MPPERPDDRPSGARHDSSLPQWAVDKMIRRRGGRRHAFAELCAARTALVVIDLAQTYIAGTPCAAAIVAPINRLAQVLRSAGGAALYNVMRNFGDVRTSDDLIAAFAQDGKESAGPGKG